MCFVLESREFIKVIFLLDIIIFLFLNSECAGHLDDYGSGVGIV